MEECIFCKIIRDEIPAYKIYEDEYVLSFMDVNPVSKGHCLVVPKKHFENIFDIEDDILQKISIAGKKIASQIKQNLSADGINFLQSNGSLAGQVIFHYHLHIIPRYKDDGLKTHNIFGEKTQKADVEELKKLAEKINK